MKKAFIALAIIVLIASAVMSTLLFIEKIKNSGSFSSAFTDNDRTTIIGSSTNLKSVPKNFVMANATTTNDSGSATVTQMINTSGVRKVNMFITAKGGTATSTLYIKQMASFDETNFFEVGTTTPFTFGTSTVVKAGTNSNSVKQFVPGTATTTFPTVTWDIDGYKNTYFLIYGTDISTDPNDRIQAWIEAFSVKDTN